MAETESNLISLDELIAKAQLAKQRKLDINDVLESLRTGELKAKFELPSNIDDHDLLLLRYDDAIGIANAGGRVNKTKAEYLKESTAIFSKLAMSTVIVVEIDVSAYDSLNGINNGFDLKNFSLPISDSDDFDVMESEMSKLFTLALFVVDNETQPPSDLIKLIDIKLVFGRVEASKIYTQKELYLQVLFSSDECDRFVGSLDGEFSMLSKVEIRRRAQYRVYREWCSLNKVSVSYKELYIQKVPLWGKLREMSPQHFKYIKNADDSEFKSFFRYVNDSANDEA